MPLVSHKRDVFGREANGLDEIETGDARRAGAVAHQSGFLDVPTRQVNCVDHAGGRDDRRSVLVVMKHGNVHQFPQAAPR